MANNNKALDMANLELAMSQNNEKIKNYIDASNREVKQYQKYVNTELDYGYFVLIGEQENVTDIVLLNTKQDGNIEINNGLISLKANKTYKIFFSLNGHANGNNSVFYHMYNNTNSTFIGTVIDCLPTSYSGSWNSQCCSEMIYTPSEDCEICIKYENNGGYYFTRLKEAYLIVEEINRAITIDPLEHVNVSNGIEDTPVGHIISHMGTTAPKHHLICDGAEYQITDYPYLAQHIQDNFGSMNYFGGDGTTTFAVPDLRGEFLRGTGTATRDTGSGDGVGVHQEPTEHINLQKDDKNYLYMDGNSKTITRTRYSDKSIIVTSKTGVTMQNTATTWTASGNIYYTSRPTNTSVLYCIKYEPTYFMQVDANNNLMPTLYSEEERIIGSWIDGKPLYQKVIKTTSSFSIPSSGWYKFYNASSLNIEQIVYANFGRYENGIRYECFNEVNCYHNNADGYLYLLRQSGLHCNSGINGIIQYTKTTDEPNSFTLDMVKGFVVQDKPEIGGNCDCQPEEEMTPEQIQEAINQAVTEINTVDTPTAIPELYPEMDDIPTVIPEEYENMDTPTVIPEIYDEGETEPEVPEETEGGTEE